MPCAPRMLGCKAGCAHRRFVRDYQTERHRQEQERDAVTGGYETEISQHPDIVTFKTWLIDHAGPDPEEYPHGPE